jgi:hypothetical protein
MNISRDMCGRGDKEEAEGKGVCFPSTWEALHFATGVSCSALLSQFVLCPSLKMCLQVDGEHIKVLKNIS